MNNLAKLFNKYIDVIDEKTFFRNCKLVRIKKLIKIITVFIIYFHFLIFDIAWLFLILGSAIFFPNFFISLVFERTPDWSQRKAAPNDVVSIFFGLGI